MKCTFSTSHLDRKGEISFLSIKRRVRMRDLFHYVTVSGAVKNKVQGFGTGIQNLYIILQYSTVHYRGTSWHNGKLECKTIHI